MDVSINSYGVSLDVIFGKGAPAIVDAGFALGS